MVLNLHTRYFYEVINDVQSGKDMMLASLNILVMIH